jgi:hypothetical protein
MGEVVAKAPKENCFFCEKDKVCCWTVIVGACAYPMCETCPDQATKDFFSYSMRKDEDRQP